MIKAPTNWAKLPTYLGTVDLLTSSNYIFGGIITHPKPTNNNFCLKTKLTQNVTNIDSQLPTYYDEGTNNLGKVTNASCNTRFTLNFKSMLL